MAQNRNLPPGGTPMPEEKKHHFLFYIFQIDKKRYILDERKENLLRQWLQNRLKKGE